MISYTSESGYENFLLSYSEKLLLTRLTKCPWEIIGKEKWEKIYTRRSCSPGALGNWMFFKLKLLPCSHFSLPVPWQIFIKHWINTILVWWYCENERNVYVFLLSILFVWTVYFMETSLFSTRRHFRTLCISTGYFLIITCWIYDFGNDFTYLNQFVMYVYFLCILLVQNPFNESWRSCLL